MLKQDKVSLVESLSEEIKSASSIILVDHTGLSVKHQQELKKRLSGAQAKLSVVKNTLLKIASKNAKLPEESISDTVLSGPTAIVIAKDDPIAPLQVLYNFAKEAEIPNLKIGVIDGSFQDKEALLKLAILPSKNVLFGQVVGNISAPMYFLVGTLQGNLQKLFWILQSKSQG